MALIGYTCWKCEHVCVWPPQSYCYTHTVGVHTLLVYTIWYRKSVCQNCGFHNSPPRYERNHELIWFVRQFLRYGCIFVEAVSHIKRACDVTSQTTDQTTTDSEWYARSRRTSPVTCCRSKAHNTRLYRSYLQIQLYLWTRFKLTSVCTLLW